MEKKKSLEVVFILDASGSMERLTEDTIGGFNSVLKEQQGKGLEGFVTTYRFNGLVSLIHDRLPLSEAPLMTREDYQAYGSTALIDAVGEAMDHIKDIHRYIRKEDIPDHTLFVIITDGQENSSHRYKSEDVKKTVKAMEEKGWEFLFLGANIDAAETGASLGIREDRTANFICDSEGLSTNFKAMGAVMYDLCSAGHIDEEWSNKINADYKMRKR